MACEQSITDLTVKSSPVEVQHGDTGMEAGRLRGRPHPSRVCSRGPGSSDGSVPRYLPGSFPALEGYMSNMLQPNPQNPELVNKHFILASTVSGRLHGYRSIEAARALELDQVQPLHCRHTQQDDLSIAPHARVVSQSAITDPQNPSPSNEGHPKSTPEAIELVSAEEEEEDDGDGDGDGGPRPVSEASDPQQNHSHCPKLETSRFELERLLLHEDTPPNARAETSKHHTSIQRYPALKEENVSTRERMASPNAQFCKLGTRVDSDWEGQPQTTDSDSKSWDIAQNQYETPSQSTSPLSSATSGARGTRCHAGYRSSNTSLDSTGYFQQQDARHYMESRRQGDERNHGESEGDDADERKRRPSQRRTPEAAASTENKRLLLCPYFAYDACRYSAQNCADPLYRKCSSVNLTRIADVK